MASANVVERFERRLLSVTVVLEKTGSRGPSGIMFWIYRMLAVGDSTFSRSISTRSSHKVVCWQLEDVASSTRSRRLIRTIRLVKIAYVLQQEYLLTWLNDCVSVILTVNCRRSCLLGASD